MVSQGNFCIVCLLIRGCTVGPQPKDEERVVFCKLLRRAS
jgi:hypothetical protein